MKAICHQKTLSLLFFAVVFFAVPPFSAEASVLTKPTNNLGLVAYYAMEDATGTLATDFSGNSNTATLSGFPANPVTNWVSGKRGRALLHDGNGFITASDQTSLDLSTAGTVAFWVKRSASGVQTAFGKWDSTGSQQSYLLQVHTDNVVTMNISSTGANQTALTGGSITDTSWHHVAGTWDGTNLRVFVDGVQTNSVSSTVSVFNSTAALQSRYNAANNFSGTLDEARVYSRALSIPEIAYLYGVGAARYNNPSSLGIIGYWSFEDATGTKATDFSGSGNTGTLTGNAIRFTSGGGRLGTGIRLDGTSNNYVTAGDIASIDTATTLSACAWLKFTSGTTANSILGKFDAIGVNDGLKFSRSSGNVYTVRLGDSTDTSDITLTGTTAVPISSWNYTCFTLTLGSSTGLRIYINGVEDASSPFDVSSISAINGGTSALLIGHDIVNGTAMTGDVDEVRIYDRVLSQAEILTLYGSGMQKLNSSQNTALTSGLVGLWSFNGSDINTSFAYDRSGSNNTGTLAPQGSTTASSTVITASTTFIIPGGVTSIDVEAWGGGGGGFSISGSGAGGGSGGTYVRTTGISVTAGQSKAIVIGSGGAGGTAATNGGNTTYDSTVVVANGGTAATSTTGVLASTVGSTGTTKNAGGNGGNGTSGTADAGGGGGGAGGPDGAGSDGLPTSSNRGGDGGQGDATSGGAGGTGGNGVPGGAGTANVLGGGGGGGGDNTFQGGAGAVPGGGGGGGEVSGNPTARGGDGQVKLSYNVVTDSTTPTPTIGRVSQGLSFNGGTSYIDLGTGLDQDSEITIVGWIRPASVAAGAMSLIANASAASTSDYALFINEIAGKISFKWAGITHLAGSTTLSVNGWYHVAAVRSGSSGAWTATIYVNGASAGSASSITTNPNGSSATTSIGRLGSVDSNYYNGALDEMRIYSRALSAAEVAYLYGLAK